MVKDMYINRFYLRPIAFKLYHRFFFEDFTIKSFNNWALSGGNNLRSFIFSWILLFKCATNIFLRRMTLLGCDQRLKKDPNLKATYRSHLASVIGKSDIQFHLNFVLLGTIWPLIRVSHIC